MVGIIVRDGEPYESFIRRFRRVCERAGILRDYKKHQYYEKPSEKKKRRFIEARRKEMRRRYQNLRGSR